MHGLSHLKCELLFIVIISYTILFFIITSVMDNGEHYLKLYDSLKSDLTDQLFSQPTVGTDAYIFNAYYYPNSKSLGENAVAMVILMNRKTMRDVTKYRMQLVGSNGTSAVTTVASILKDSYSPCDYVNVVARANLLPGLTKLEIQSGDTKLNIPFKPARTTAPSPVIICLAPQFVAEQWQLFVAQAHVVRRFGGHLHLYVTSMLDSYFELVQEYEKHGYVTVDYWIRMKFANASESSAEPNSNSEFRNQAGAHTDCLLQYKEAATFITFFDLDDVLFPRGFNSYFDEFAAYSFMYPHVRTFHYNRREFSISNKANMSEIDMGDLFGHSKYGTRVDAGKLVARPSNLDSMWIHRSFNVLDKNTHVMDHNFLIHVQKPVDGDGKDPVPYGKSQYRQQPELQVNRTVLASIQRDFERMMKVSSIAHLEPHLPVHSYFFPIVFKCYFDKYYSVSEEKKLEVCPNSEGCEIPQRDDLKCVHSDAEYVSGHPMSPVRFHYHTDSRWSRTIGCYQ